ncbi:MAG: hypothetical protein PUA51_03410 [Oscillospiraceae bacterium]|nr:hypothetical protein [Oscillospiraceae bacterium]
MKNFKAKFMGFIKNISEGIIYGNFVATVIFQIFCVFLALIGEPDFFNITAFYLVLDAFVIISTVFVLYKSGSIHKIDADIIGNNFIGFGKKSRNFRKAVEDFCNDDFPKAINELKDIEEKYNLSDSENGVLCFYVARCYDIMSYYPNALNYYEKAEKSGFSDESIILFKANCIGASGDTEQALSIYNDILNSDNRYSIYVRTYIGKMYLENRQPEKALKWYLEAVEKRENYAMALGGCSLAYLMLGNKEESQKYYQYAIINNMSDLEGFKAYYKEISESLKGSDSVV